MASVTRILELAFMAENKENRVVLLGGRVRLTRPQAVLAVIVAAYVLGMFLLAKCQHDNFGFQSNETGAANNVLWNMLQGHPYRLAMIGDLNYLALHAEFFWLLLLPVYALFPGVSTLLFLQSAALGLTAVPIYLIVRRVWKDEVAGVLMGLAFLFMPAIASGNLNQIHPVPYLPVFILFAYYFFLEERLGPFLVFALLACFVRENAGLVVCMFGVLAWINRRGWKWRLVPFITGLGYFLLITQVVMAAAQQGREWHVAKYFTYLGATPGEIVKNALTQPGLVINHLLGGENIQYFVWLVQPLGWVLPFLGPAAIVALPDLAGNLLSDNGGLKVITWHYQFVTTSGLFVGAIFGAKRLLDRLQRHDGRANYAPVMGAGFACLCLAHWFLWFQPVRFQRLPHHDTLVKVIEFIPPTKSVLAPIRLTAHFSSREHFDCVDRWTKLPAYCAQYEYVILDANERQFPPPVTREFFDAFHKNPNYRLVFSEQNVFVFQRQGEESDWKVQPE